MHFTVRIHKTIASTVFHNSSPMFSLRTNRCPITFYIVVVPLGYPAAMDQYSKLFKKTGYRTLLFLSFSTQTIADIVAVTIPIFALSLHASPFEIGLLATSRGVVYAVCPFLAGYVLGRADRRESCFRLQ